MLMSQFMAMLLALERNIRDSLILAVNCISNQKLCLIND